jgi:hypothetical protein
MKKVVWIDVGTHFAQEHGSIFSSNVIFYFFIIRRFISSKLFRRGKFVTLQTLKEIISTRNKLRKKTQDFYSIFIEANSEIARKMKFYPEADLFFNLALTNNSSQSPSITKLYLGDGNALSQGSSIFLEKHNVKQENFVAAFGVSTNDFFKELELYLSNQFSDYVAIIRLNCEGVEDDVIYSAHKYFGSKLQLICGSLKDVKGVKGPEALNRLEGFISENGLVFAKFYAPIYTWLEGHQAILRLLRKLD